MNVDRDKLEANKRRFMRLTPNCLPVTMPIWQTLITLLMTEVVVGAPLLISVTWVMLIANWTRYLLGFIYDIEVDIFENYRTMKDDE